MRTRLREILAIECRILNRAIQRLEREGRYNRNLDERNNPVVAKLRVGLRIYENTIELLRKEESALAEDFAPP